MTYASFVKSTLERFQIEMAFNRREEIKPKWALDLVNTHAHGSEFIRFLNAAVQIGLCLGSEITLNLKQSDSGSKKSLASCLATWESTPTQGLCTHCFLCMECFSPTFLTRRLSINSNISTFNTSSLISPPHSFVSVLFSP